MQLQQSRPIKVSAQEILREGGDFFQERIRKLINRVAHISDCLLAIHGEPGEIKDAFEKVSEYLKDYSHKNILNEITITNYVGSNWPDTFLISRRDCLKTTDERGNWVPCNP